VGGTLAHDAFISYSQHDKVIADAVCHRMEAAGIRCWIAPRDIAHGKTWDDAIVDAITAANLLVVIFSAAANASRSVLDEVATALDAGVTVIPFRIEDIRPTGALLLHLGRVHWLDALTPPIEAPIDQLIESAKRNLPATKKNEDGPLGTPQFEEKPEQEKRPANHQRQDAEQQQLAEGEQRPREQQYRRQEEERLQQEQVSSPQTQEREEEEQPQRRRPFLRRPAAAIFVIVALLLVLVAAWMLVPRQAPHLLMATPAAPPPAPKSSAAEALQNGNEAFDRKDYAEALRWYRNAADQGNAQARGNIGHLYLWGLGVSTDYDEAMRWSRKAADQGDPRGQTIIGVLYNNGWGVAQDYAEAMRWYRKAADQGYAPAQTDIGVLYENGRGVAQNMRQARVWMQKAADAGNDNAKKWLASH
jgi:TPR repeat protein